LSESTTNVPLPEAAGVPVAALLLLAMAASAAMPATAPAPKKRRHRRHVRGTDDVGVVLRMDFLSV
jgi:hypothetical protein